MILYLHSQVYVFFLESLDFSFNNSLFLFLRTFEMTEFALSSEELRVDFFNLFVESVLFLLRFEHILFFVLDFGIKLRDGSAVLE